MGSAACGSDPAPQIQEGLVFDANTGPQVMEAPATIKDAQFIGSDLLITFQFAGGCPLNSAPHRFTLHTQGTLAESLPPQLITWVRHDDQQDPCGQLQTDQVRFDASKAIALIENNPQDFYITLITPDEGGGTTSTKVLYRVSN